jgi:hypothetical protein
MPIARASWRPTTMLGEGVCIHLLVEASARGYRSGLRHVKTHAAMPSFKGARSLDGLF